VPVRDRRSTSSKTREKPGEKPAPLAIVRRAEHYLKGIQAAPEHSSFASLPRPIYRFNTVSRVDDAVIQIRL